MCRLWLTLPMLHPISLPGPTGQPPHIDGWVAMSGCNLPGEFSGAVGVFYPGKNNGHFFFLVLSVISCLETHARARKAVPTACRATQGCPQPMCWWPVMGLAGQPGHWGGLQVLTSLPAGSLPAFCKASGLFAAVSEVLDETPHQLRLSPLVLGTSMPEPSWQCRIHQDRAGAHWQVMW